MMLPLVILSALLLLPVQVLSQTGSSMAMPARTI